MNMHLTLSLNLSNFESIKQNMIQVSQCFNVIYYHLMVML